MKPFMKTLDWLFGTKDTAEILDLKLTFNFGLPTWLAVFLLILIGVYCYQIYKREAAHLGKWMRGFLATLRFITYAGLLLAFLKPSLLLDRMIEPKSNVAVLIDSSLSMGIVEKGASEQYLNTVADATKSTKDEAKEMDRMAIVNRILNNKDLDLINKLEQKYSLRFFSFDKTAVGRDVIAEDGTVKNLAAEGEITQLGAAMRQAAHDLRGHPLAGMILLTDGGNNKGEDPEVVAQSMGKKKVRLFPVGIGMPQAVDIKVVDFNIPDLIFKNEDLAVEVTFEGSEVAGNLIPVDLYLGDVKVGGEAITAQDETFKHTFVIKAENVGDYTFKVTAEEQPNEYFVENNQKSKQIRVIDNAIRILFVIENPSWEYRYLKGLLDTDKRVDAKVFIRKGDPRRSRSDPQYLSRFPFETLNKDFDCLVFCNIRADYFDQRRMKMIQDYVVKEGGSMIMISSTSGTPGTFAGTPIGDMLPVQFNQIPENEQLDLQDRFTRGYSLKLTREGKYHNVTRLEPIPEKNEELWPTLPPQYWYYTGIKRLKPSAIALVEHGRAVNEYGPIPLLAIHRFGKGQVLFSGLNSIWRWRYKVGNRYTNRFWIQTIQFMGLPHLLGNMKRVQVMTEGRNFTVGEKIDVTAKVLTENFTPVRDESITLSAKHAETLEEQTFKIPVDSNKEGFFNGSIFLKKGMWNITVDGYADEEKLVLDISEPRYEFEKPAMHQKALEAVAAASGGQFIKLEELSSLTEKISESVELIRSPIEKTLWDTWFMLLLVVLTASTEWFFRKRVDLP